MPPKYLQWTVENYRGEVLAYSGVSSIAVKNILNNYLKVSVADQGGCYCCNYAEIEVGDKNIIQPITFNNPVEKGGVLDLEVGVNEGITDESVSIYRIVIVSEIFGIVRSVETTDTDIQISLDGLAAGVYYLQFYADNEFVATSKLIVE